MHMALYNLQLVLIEKFVEYIIQHFFKNLYHQRDFLSPVSLQPNGVKYLKVRLFALTECFSLKYRRSTPFWVAKRVFSERNVSRKNAKIFLRISLTFLRNFAFFHKDE